MQKLLLIGLGGFAGAIMRYLMSGLPHKYLNGSFPYGTLLVNVLGCLLIGALMFLVEDRRMLASGTRLFLITGILGSFTTFSTFGFETYALLRESQYVSALANIGANLVFGLVAVVAGWTLMKSLNI